MKLKDKEKLNNPLKGWQILSSISSMVFHTVVSDKGVCRTAPDTPGLLNICLFAGLHQWGIYLEMGDGKQ